MIWVEKDRTIRKIAGYSLIVHSRLQLKTPLIKECPVSRTNKIPKTLPSSNANPAVKTVKYHADAAAEKQEFWKEESRGGIMTLRNAAASTTCFREKKEVEIEDVNRVKISEIPQGRSIKETFLGGRLRSRVLEMGRALGCLFR